MTFAARIRRVTDLFVEGKELFLGLDDDEKPVVVWVNKLNSFQEEEARRDGASMRSLRRSKLNDPENLERSAAEAEMRLLEDRVLAARLVAMRQDELDSEIYHDLFADETWMRNWEDSRRARALLDEEGVPEEDQRRQDVADMDAKWTAEFERRRKRAIEEAETDALDSGRKDMEEAFISRWLDQVTLTEFVEERRVTTMFLALRDCQAEDLGFGADGARRWNHSACDHTQPLLDKRSEVRDLPEDFIVRAASMLQDITIPTVEAGNSDAPVSSSAPSEQSVAEVEESSPSSRDEMPDEPPES